MRKYLRSPVVLAVFFISTLLSGHVFAEGLAGEWVLTIDTPRGEQHPTLVVEQKGAQYSGVYNSLRGPIDVETIDFDGSNFSFPLVITVPIGAIEVNYRGSIDGDKMAGSVQNPRGEVQFTGQRGE